MPAMQEIEIGRIKVPGQLRQKSSQSTISTEKSWLVVCACHPAMVRSIKSEDHGSGQSGQKDPISKVTTAKRAGDVEQAI
jgi:hypothetical protein